MRKVKTERLLMAVAFLILAISIGVSACRDWMIRTRPAFAVGLVYEYINYPRDNSCRIDYTYEVKGKTYRSRYRSSSLPADLKNKHIVIRYSRQVPRWNEPMYQYVVPDSTGTPSFIR